MPRDRNGTFEPVILPKGGASTTNELEDKIIGMYAKGMSVRDIQEQLEELYGVQVSPATVSATTDKMWGLVEAWQSRPLAEIYTIVYLDTIHLKIRRENKVENTAVYVVLGVDLEGHRDILGHWIGEGSEGANFWLSVITDLQTRGVKDILIACMDGLTGFKEALQAVFPKTEIQRCVIHQIRNSLKYISWKDRKAFMVDLRQVYGAPTREAAEAALQALSEKWSGRYAVAIRSWQNNWEDLAHLLPLSDRDPPLDLHHQFCGGLQPTTAQSHQVQRRVTFRRCRQKAAFPGLSRHHQKVDHAHLQLAADPQPARHPF